MKVYAVTRCGIGKSENEDRILIGKTILALGEYTGQLPSGIVAIADGVGGNQAGSIASQYVCNRLAMETVIDESTFKHFNEELLAFGKTKKEWEGLATTLSGILITENMVKIFHVGNTRIYKLQGGQYLRQLTSDDTTVNYLVKTGKLSEEDAENYSARNEITACFGGSDIKLLRPCFFNDKLEETAVYLMTSDGIHETLCLDDMEEVFDETVSYLEICQQLINTAVERGSKDDCTAVIVVCGEESNGMEIS
ncbi:PP2C family protein-serine/threonine phosphatase [Lacrimispora sp. 210928-DFI.3.58]|uniref:PP2C family protein-serine/threonine phosphatase n=1 Tax=Lacrimispora sp. 210928-DFI.3.58 TaxID=2883214 RepID=UPI001D098B9D|nr:PP2C family serine/threonine-protein phosphatase [Lacrimispora sp. 210928-DFI.3.58]MCB7320456.1 protein phosphatase 2C domain-containing protein [Lacrimispora sp. 210928-DFI.3.58]